MTLTDEDLLAISQLLKAEIEPMQSDIQDVKQRIALLEMSIENEVSKNISILAENHLSLIDKLNQAVKVSDKNLIYEVQVNLLSSKVEKLEKEVAELKSRTA